MVMVVMVIVAMCIIITPFTDDSCRVHSLS